MGKTFEIVEEVMGQRFESIYTHKDTQGNKTQEAIWPIMPAPHQHYTNLSTRDHKKMQNVYFFKVFLVVIFCRFCSFFVVFLFLFFYFQGTLLKCTVF